MILRKKKENVSDLVTEIIVRILAEQEEIILDLSKVPTGRVNWNVAGNKLRVWYEEGTDGDQAE